MADSDRESPEPERPERDGSRSVTADEIVARGRSVLERARNVIDKLRARLVRR
jgi:hypothetical protein